MDNDKNPKCPVIGCPGYLRTFMREKEEDGKIYEQLIQECSACEEQKFGDIKVKK